MNFLELLLCIALTSILASVSVFGYQSLMLRTRLHADTQVVYTALNQARAQGGAVGCNQDQCVLKTKTNEKVFKLSGMNRVETRLFPSHAENIFVFDVNGLTQFHNGTIILTPPEHPDLARSIKVSQGGRITS